MLAYLRHHYFLIHAYPKDPSGAVSLHDLSNVCVFKVSVPNLESQLKSREEYKHVKKWDLRPDQSYLEYELPDPDIAKKVFATFQRSIDHILDLYDQGRPKKPEVDANASNTSETERMLLVYTDGMTD